MRRARFDFTWLVLVASLAVMAYAGYQLWPDRPLYEVVEPDRVLGELPVGSEQVLHFTVRNLSKKPIRVVGAEFT